MAYTPLAPFLSVVQSIQDYVSRLGFLAETRWVLNDIRVTPTGTVTVGWTLTTVTTVSTVTSVTAVASLTNQVSNGWYFTNHVVPSAMNVEAILGNIDNLILS